jgi:hypothetical protein
VQNKFRNLLYLDRSNVGFIEIGNQLCPRATYKYPQSLLGDTPLETFLMLQQQVHISKEMEMVIIRCCNSPNSLNLRRSRKNVWQNLGTENARIHEVGFIRYGSDPDGRKKYLGLTPKAIG